MKTDRFDEEFRRKLRGLPQASSPDEVNRIADHVSRNLPPAPVIGWGGLAGYVAGGLVLLGSLLYNVVQHQKTMTLQTTVDSLKMAPPALAQQPAPTAPPPTRTDTVYVTRYQHQSDLAPIVLHQPTARNEKQPAQAMPDAARNLLDNTTLANPEIKSETGLKSVRKEAVTATEPPTDLTGATTTETIVKNDEPVRSKSERPKISAEPAVSNSLRNMVSTSKHAPNRRDLARTKARRTTKANSPVNDVLAHEQMDKTTTEQTTADLTVLNSVGSRPVELVEPLTELEKQSAERSEMAVSLLKNKPLESANMSAAISRKPVYQPVANASPVQKPFRLHLPTVSLSNPQYFGGLGLSAGDEHIGGSLLGEVRLTSRWSVQTGVRLLAQTGFDYRSSEEFEKCEGQDFHALYAPSVAPGTEIRHIHQLYGLVQIPLAVAYHYPMGRAWALRLGVGTNLDLLAHSRITFEYERNGREFEQGINESNTRVSLFNNATVSLGLERQWKRLLLRASPYVSPQLKRVSYQDDAVYWGGQVQVLWQFK